MKSFIKNPLFLFLLFVLMSSFLPKDILHSSSNQNISKLNFDTSSCVLNPSRDGIRVGDDKSIPSGYPDPAKIYIDAFTSKYSGGDLNFVRGGSISKCVLLNILKSMDEKEMYVNYRFGIDETSQHHNILILQGGNHNPADYSNIMGQKLKYRTGSSDESFCPMKCNW